MPQRSRWYPLCYAVALVFALTTSLYAELPKPVVLMLSDDFDRVIIEYNGWVDGNKANNLIEGSEAHLKLKENEVGSGKILWTADKELWKALGGACGSDAFVLSFYALGEGEGWRWDLPSTSAFQIERMDGEIWVTNELFAMHYEFTKEGYLNPVIERVSPGGTLTITPNPTPVNFEAKDLSVFDGVPYSVVDDPSVGMIFAVLPLRSQNGVTWPYKDRSTFKVSMVQRKGDVP